MTRGEIRREALGWLRCILLALVFVFLLRLYVFEIVRVDGPSMQPTLYTGEYLFINKFRFDECTLQRGDIVLCSFPDEAYTYVKRIIGMPGETISIQEGRVYIDAQPLKETYVHIGKQESMPPRKLSQDAYFVLGDHRANSYDSRRVGAIGRAQLIGRVEAVLWPPANWEQPALHALESQIGLPEEESWPYSALGGPGEPAW